MTCPDSHTLAIERGHPFEVGWHWLCHFFSATQLSSSSEMRCIQSSGYRSPKRMGKSLTLPTAQLKGEARSCPAVSEEIGSLADAGHLPPDRQQGTPSSTRPWLCKQATQAVALAALPLKIPRVRYAASVYGRAIPS